MTDWIDGTLQPVRPGVYLRDFGVPGQFYSFWHPVGGWGPPCETVAGAVRLRRRRRSLLQSLPWRGVLA